MLLGNENPTLTRWTERLGGKQTWRDVDDPICDQPVSVLGLLISCPLWFLELISAKGGKA